MKKTLTLIALAGMFSFYACGPSAEQKAAAEKAKQDSIAAVEAAVAAEANGVRPLTRRRRMISRQGGGLPTSVGPKTHATAFQGFPDWNRMGICTASRLVEPHRSGSE